MFMVEFGRSIMPPSTGMSSNNFLIYDSSDIVAEKQVIHIIISIIPEAKIVLILI